MKRLAQGHVGMSILINILICCWAQRIQKLRNTQVVLCLRILANENFILIFAQKKFDKFNSNLINYLLAAKGAIIV